MSRHAALLQVVLLLNVPLCLAAARAAVGRVFSYIGPFPSGKTELDGDPVGAFGGPLRAPNGSTTLYRSELVAGGVVKWTSLSMDSAGAAALSPRVDWNPLVQSLSRLEVLEHVGWAVSHVDVTGTSAPARVRVSCFGVVSFALHALDSTSRPTLYAGDIYRSGGVAAYVSLSPGRHPLVLRVRLKVRAPLAARRMLCRPLPRGIH